MKKREKTFIIRLKRSLLNATYQSINLLFSCLEIKKIIEMIFKRIRTTVVCLLFL